MNSHHGSRGAATPLADEKVRMRARMRRLRIQLSLRLPNAAQSLAELGFERLLEARKEPGIVAGYSPTGAEMDPTPLLSRFSRAGWRVALPRAIDPFTFLVFGNADAPRTPDAFGVPAPSEWAERLIPDVVLVPLLAFDRSGHRLGQGAGSYDRTLARLRQSGTVLSVGLAFAGQVVERVPVDAHDAPLELILTERGPVDVVRT